VRPVGQCHCPAPATHQAGPQLPYADPRRRGQLTRATTDD